MKSGKRSSSFDQRRRRRGARLPEPRREPYRLVSQVVLLTLFIQTSGVAELAALTSRREPGTRGVAEAGVSGAPAGSMAERAAAGLAAGLASVWQPIEEAGSRAAGQVAALAQKAQDEVPDWFRSLGDQQGEQAPPPRPAEFSFPSRAPPPLPPGLTLPPASVGSSAASELVAPGPVPSQAVDLSQVPLLVGPNLISLPNEPPDTDPAVVLAPIAGQYTAVYAYDNCDPADPWKIYDPADPPGSDLTAIDHTPGLWVDATASTSLPSDGSQPAMTSIQLCTGWNLIGYPLAQERPVPAALASIAGKYVRVFGFELGDAADPWEVYDVAAPDWANDLRLMRPGRGYWVLATEDTILDYENQGAAPTVDLLAPADLAEVTQITDVVGTVQSNLLERWTVSVRPAGDAAAPFVELLSGDAPVQSAVLGRFDPTLLLNGLYELRLQAVDFQGQTSEETIAVSVDGQAKVGAFTLSFSDLQVPVSGLDIEILRIYDSRDKEVGDFGVGWRLDIKQGTYRNNRMPGQGWQIVAGFLPCQNVQETLSHVTTIRLSDVEIYRFGLKLFSPAPTLGGCFAQARFDFVDGPIPGATLGILGNTDVFFQNGTNEVIDIDTFEIYEPRNVRLTTRDGRVFDVNLANGVSRLADRNGNELQISPNSITHSSGLSIAITRDAQERITQISDPLGATLGYQYDGAGDLVASTDRGGSTTTYTYDGNHGLLDIFNPQGTRPLRNDYDAQGRLTSTTDASGNTFTFSRDLDARREVLTNRLGFARVLEYDERGNVTREIDELGNETVRTFDAKDNLLTETDPLGRTQVLTYSPGNDLASTTDPLGNTIAYTYDAAGRVLTTTDPRSNTTTNVYDANGNLTQVTDALGGVRTFTYDARGNLTSETDPLGNVTTSTYDGRGNLTSRTDALGNVTTFTYDANGNRLTEVRTRTLPGGATETLTTSFAYDALDRLVSTTAPDGTVTSRSYDPFGRIASSTDPLGRSTSFLYDGQGQLVSTVFADGTGETTIYDAEGRVVSEIDRAGRATQLSYDRVGNLLATTFADGSVSSNSYDAANQQVSSTDERGNTTSFLYDDAGRRTQVTDALGNVHTFAYDEAGNQSSSTDARGNTTSFAFDALNRLTLTTFEDATTRSFGYDAAGRKISETDQAGRTTLFDYDALGQLLSVTDALGQVTAFTYDEVGNRLTQTDANGNTTTFGYDTVGRLISRTLPDGSVETKTYNGDGTLSSHTDFIGRTTTFAYDVNSRLIRRDHPDATSVVWTYTPTGQRSGFSDTRGPTTFTYDARDRVTSMTYPDGRRLDYGYDPAGNRTALTATVGATGRTTVFTYDALNRLDTVTDSSGGVYTHAYDSVGNRTSLSYPNGVTTSTQYDALNRLSLLTTSTSGATTLQSYSFTLDATGRRTRIDEADGTSRAYSYDALYRLTQDSVTDGAATLVYSQDFTYDPVGNRLTLTEDTGSGPVVTSYTYDNRDRLLTEGAINYGYDANGNVTSEGGTAAYGWNTRDQLTSTTLADGTQVTTFYDPDGNRVRTETTPSGGPTETVDYLVDTSRPLSQVVAESDGAGNTIVLYERGDELLSLLRPAISQRRYFHADGLGSVRLLTDALENVTDSYAYTAFGVELDHSGTDSQPYRFTGEPFDPNIGFYYNRARWLDVGIGRFAGMDPFEGVLSEPLSLHRYLYVSVDPVNAVDPSGRFSLTNLAIAIAVRVTIFTMRHPVLTAVIGIVANLLVPAELGEAMLASGNPFGVAFGSASVGRARFFALVKSGRFRAFVRRNLSAAGRLWQVTGDEFEDFLRQTLRASRPVPVGAGRQSADMLHRTILIEAKTGTTLSGREIAQLDAIAGEAAQNGTGFVYAFLTKPTRAAIRRIEEAGGSVLWFFENVGG